MPETSSTDWLAAVVEDLITVVQNPHSPTTFLQRGVLTNDTIQKIQIICMVPANSNNDTNHKHNRTDNQLIKNEKVLRVNTCINN